MATEFHGKLDEMSTQDFRNLAEAPISASPVTVAEADEALANRAGDDIDALVQAADLDDEVLVDDDDRIDEGLSTSSYEVVLESDLPEDSISSHIHSPDMDAPDTPGQIDIEDLYEDDLDGTSLPPDARLDPIEE